MTTLFKTLCFLCPTRRYYSSFQKARSGHLERRINLFQQGATKLCKELDSVKMLTRMRQLDLLTSILLTKEQKILMNYQKKNLLRQLPDRFSSSEGEDNGQPEYKQIIRTQKKAKLGSMAKE